MSQAIEGGFILDVLNNYTTYKMYYKIAKYESLRPHNLAQKTEIMIEHFRNSTKTKIGGKAKGYTDLDVLVAFSGVINDDME